MVVTALNQEKALIGAFSVLKNLRMELFRALLQTGTGDCWLRRNVKTINEGSDLGTSHNLTIDSSAQNICYIQHLFVVETKICKIFHYNFSNLCSFFIKWYLQIIRRPSKKVNKWIYLDYLNRLNKWIDNWIIDYFSYFSPRKVYLLELNNRNKKGSLLFMEPQ